MATSDNVALRRFHLTDRPVTRVRAGGPQATGRKPDGLWWSVGTAWRDHVRRIGSKRGFGMAKRFRDACFAYEVTLKPDPGILVIRTPTDLMDATLRYGMPMPHVEPGRLSRAWEMGEGSKWQYRPDLDPFLAKHNRCPVANMDWAAVARDYRGVEIMLRDGVLADPGRVGFEWADLDWEVSSGCIWDTRALESVVQVPWETLDVPGTGTLPPDPEPTGLVPR